MTATQHSTEAAREGLSALIGTQWEGRIQLDGWQPGGGGSAAVVDKATGRQLAAVGLASPADVARASQLASDAQREWAATSGYERARILRAAAAELERQAEMLIAWLCSEGGQIDPNAAFEVQWSAERLLAASQLAIAAHGELLAPVEGELSIARRVPVGVVGAITPWNAPLALAFRVIAPALALGNAVVLKPDSNTAVCGGVAIAAVLAAAGLPDGLLALVPGDVPVGEALVEDPRVGLVSFTGSTAVGRRVGEAAGRSLKRVSLELGGNNALIVLDDADIERVISASSFGSFINQGQVCMAAGRHLVQRGIAEKYCRALAAHAAELTVGDPSQGQVHLGPMINAHQLEHVDRIVSETAAAGAEVLAGGARRDPFYPPTVLRGVTPEMPAFREEIFGPVAPVTLFDTDDEAVELANATEYGLAGAVFTGDPYRGLRLAQRLRAGMVHVNDQTINDQHTAPMGGFGASGNGSRFGPQAHLDEFTQWQWITVHDEPKAYPF